MKRLLKPTCKLLICFLAVQLLSWSLLRDLLAFAIFPPNHQLVTHQALGDCCFKYTMPNGEEVFFSTDALSTVSFGNLNMDILSLKDEQVAEDFHFDDERFDFGQFVLLFTRDLIVFQLQDEAFSKSDPQSLLRRQMLTRTSREMLGNALHTLQDYYAHTNWVERGLQNGNLAINPVLGAKGKSLHGPSEQACNENSPGLSQLTSGYYLASGVKDCANICSAPANECAHGNIICPGLDCGINKDVSPRDHFSEAFDLATEHTAVFVRQIFAESLTTIPADKNRVSLAICELMGVPDAANKCVPRHTLTVQKVNQAGGGAVTQGLVKSSSGDITPAIDCGSVCQGTAVADSEVQLTASDTGNWRFVRWAPGGVCAGSTSPECSFVADSNKTAKAEFFEDEFGFEVAESEAPWGPTNPRLNCFHYEGEYLVTGYVASFDRCYSGMSAVIRCVGSSCDSSRFKVAISKSIMSYTDGTCHSSQDPFGADPGSAHTYVPGSNWWFGLGKDWTKAWPSISNISPLANGNFIFQNFHWIGDDPGAACVGDQARTLELEFNVYDVTTGNYTKIPFVINVP